MRMKMLHPLDKEFVLNIFFQRLHDFTNFKYIYKHQYVN